MFGLSDIVALAKSGYSVADVKELIALSKDVPAEQQHDNNQSNNEQQQENPPAPSEPDNKPDEKPEADAKVKELEDQIKALQTQLTAAQNANVNKDQSGNYKPVDHIAALTDLFRKG